MIVLGAGTGGTITGIGRKFKEKLPSCKIVGADPEGSTLAGGDRSDFYEVEGIGYDFTPTVLDRQIVDSWEKTHDKETFLMARDLIMKEGLLCGGSSGSAVVAALKAAKGLDETKRVVVVLADGVRNYMTKFLSDNWMIDRGYITKQVAKIEASPVEEKPWFWNLSVSKIAHSLGLETVTGETKSIDAIKKMKTLGFDQLPVVASEGGALLGMITVSGLMAKIAAGGATIDSAVSSALITHFPKIGKDGTLGELTAMLKASHYVVIVDNLDEAGENKLAGILTHIDVLNYLIHADSQ